MSPRPGRVRDPRQTIRYRPMPPAPPPIRVNRAPALTLCATVVCAPPWSVRHRGRPAAARCTVVAGQVIIGDIRLTPKKDYLITHKPQPVLAAGKALELFGHWPSKGVAS